MYFTNTCPTQVILINILTGSFILVNGSTCTHNITVSSNGTLNTSDCWYNQHDPCSQLSDAFNATNYFKNVCIYVLSDIVLSKSVTLENVANIVFSGSDQQVIVSCVELVGLSFLNSSNIVISNLIFDNCSTNHTSTSYNSTNPVPLPLHSALYFSGCNDTTFYRVTVRHSNGTGVTMYDVNGLVNISYSVFSHNVPYSHNGGGGLYIEFTYENPEYNISQSCPANYIIYECQFTYNVADVQGENVSLFIQPFEKNHLSFSRGGGISVYFKGSAQNKTINISNCVVDNNSAYWGAGIFAEFQDRSNGNNFNVDSTKITNNKCPRLNKDSGTGGGGVRTGYIFYNPFTIHNNSISFVYCNISNNTAYWGGGVSYRTSPQQKVITATNIISFTECTFDHNEARLGSAVDLTVWHGLPVGAYSDIVFNSCKFLANSISYTDKGRKLIGKGAVYVDSLPVEFFGSNLFENNNGSALAVLSSGIRFHNTTDFFNNQGDNGGAIALLGDSWVTVNEGVLLSFEGNKAHDRGGAIYAMSIGEHDLISSRNCFIRYYNSSVFVQDWNAKFNFTNNKATVAGNSIYTTTLLPCLWTTSDASMYNLTSAMKSLFTDHPFYFTNKSGGYTDIATAASQFNYSKGSFIPGQLKKLPMNITDDKGNTANTYTTFVASVTETNGAVVLDNDTKYSSNQIFRFYGEPHSTANLVLKTTSTTPYSVNMAVDITNCPPGLCLRFNHNSENTGMCSCNCGYQGVSSCDIHVYESTIAPLFWAGYVDKSHNGDEKYFTTAYCPNGFCSSSNLNFSDYRELDVVICKPQSRTGILCGECINGTSVYSSSFTSECGECHNLRHGKYFGLLQYALYEIIPLVIFFLLLVLFNFSLTSGPLNGFIFFSQVVSSIAAYNNLFQLGHTDHILIIYSIWNLSFLGVILPSYCIMENWTTLDVFAFHYISAIMPLILVLLVVLVMNYGRVICGPLFRVLHCCTGSFCRLTFVSIKSKNFLIALKRKFFYPDSKVLHGIVAVMVLSYAKFLALSFLILQPSYSLRENWPSNISRDGQLRFLLDGSVIYFGPTHIKYAIPAIIVIVISIFPPVILFLRPFLQKYEKVEQLLRRWLPLTRFDLFLNEFYSCYRPNFQWYASLYFFYRLALFFSASFTLLSQQYIIQQLLCAAFLIVHCIVQPYNRRLYNVVDGLILGVLLCLSCLEGHYFFVGHGIIDEHWPTEYIGFVLACIPIAYLMIYMLSVIIKYCKSAYHQTYHSGDGLLEDDFDIEEEREEMFGNSDSLLSESHNREASQSNSGQQPSVGSNQSRQRLHSVVDSEPSRLVNSAPPMAVSANYKTFSDQPD